MFKMMKSGLLGGVLLVAALAASGATLSLTNINSPVSNPSLNATTIINNSAVTTSGLQLYEVQNAVNITNRFGASFTGNPGLNFETITNTLRFPLANFVNQGVLTAGGGLVKASATNLVNSGTIDVSGSGAIHLSGYNLNLRLGGLQAGSATGQYPGNTGIVGGAPIYWNPSLVEDVYWGVGSNQVQAVNGTPIDQRNDFSGTLFSSLIHDVTDRRYPGSTRISTIVAPSNGNPFSVYVFIRQSAATNYQYSIVYLATNNLDTNITASVLFDASGAAGIAPVVRFAAATDTDSVSGTAINNELYFIDRLSTFSNSVLSAGRDAVFGTPTGTSRPRAYEITRATPAEWSAGSPSNSTLYASTVFQMTNDFIQFTPGFLDLFGNPNNTTIFESVGNPTPDPGYQTGIHYRPGGSNSIVTNIYAAYSAQVGSLVYGEPINPGNPSLSDPADDPGRVKIEADILDMSRSRLRAESLLTIRCTNDITVTNAVLDAPNVNLFLTNTVKPVLALTNLLNAGVRRFNGQVYAWSGAWTNDFIGPRKGAVSNYTARFSVLMLDASRLFVGQPITVDQMQIRSTNVVMNNPVRPGHSFVLDAQSLTFDTANQLDLSSGSIIDWANTNLPSLWNFTNRGSIVIAGQGKFGSDRSAPYSNMVNSGSIVAAGHSISALNYQDNGVLTASNGSIALSAQTARLQGRFDASGNISLSAWDLNVSNFFGTNRASLVLNVTNSINDGGTASTSRFDCLYGFNLMNKPASGDLLGSKIVSTIPINTPVPHVWAGENRGAARAGYSNNVAVGWLTINSGPNSLATFSGTGADNALYVDYLELLGAAQADVNSAMEVDTNMTIYFANANVPVESLDGQLGGRLRWVRSYAGPNSSSPATLASGQIITVNSALVSSGTLDSDADGVTNAFDSSPFDGVAINSRVTFVPGPPLTAQISWRAAAQTVYQVDYATTLSTNINWLPLLTYTNNAATNGIVTVSDVVPPAGEPRFYRVSYSP